MAITTTVPRRPASFYVPVTAAFGALAGLFVGTAQGSGPLGIVVGALLIGAIAFGLTHAPLPEKPLRWGLVALFALAGLLMGGLSAGIIGAAFGWFFGWMTFWLYEGRYRAHLVPYLTPGQVPGTIPSA